MSGACFFETRLHGLMKSRTWTEPPDCMFVWMFFAALELFCGQPCSDSFCHVFLAGGGRGDFMGSLGQGQW